jgi:hypothetical protein
VGGLRKTQSRPIPPKQKAPDAKPGLSFELKLTKLDRDFATTGVAQSNLSLTPTLATDRASTVWHRFHQRFQLHVATM